MYLLVLQAINSVQAAEIPDIPPSIQIPPATTSVGADNAAEVFFSKPLPRLNRREMLTLAVLANAPDFFLNNADQIHPRYVYLVNQGVHRRFWTSQEASAHYELGPSLIPADAACPPA